MANMLGLILGGIALVVGIAIGFWLGRNSGQTEVRLIRERVGDMERDKASSASESKQLNEQITRLTGELGTANASLKAEQSKYTQMKSDMETVFGNLAAEALRANTQSFLTIARQELGGQNSDAKKTLEAKELAIKNLLDPIGAALKSLGEQTQGMEQKRSEAYGEVKTLVENIQASIPTSLEALKNETAQLITALRSPKTRGNWGELQLKLCVEYAGMVQYCSFSEQVSVRNEADRLLQPDMTIQLPNGREIIVDAKTPLDAFLPSGASLDPAAHAARLIAHAVRVKEHLKSLSGKKYWEQFQKAPEFVVCFLPSEALFSAALEADPSLIEFSSKNNVVMATPTTLIALLKAVAYGWQQSEITKNAKDIHEAGKKVYEKLVTAQEYVTNLGKALGNAVGRYNDFVGAIDGHKGAFTYGRQLGELVHSGEDLNDIKSLQPDIRGPKSKEWTQPVHAIAASGSDSDSLAS